MEWTRPSEAVVPLWADHIGLDAALVAVIFGISSAMDMVLFYPAGSASDRFGRKPVLVGAGLAGSEAAWQIAQRGVPVVLYDMKPERLSPARRSSCWTRSRRG